MLRRLLLAMPAVAAGIVLWAVLSTGWPAPVRIARVVGGPTLGTRVLAWQLSVQRLAGERREPSPELAVRLLVDTGTEQAEWTGSTDLAGRVEARVRLATPLHGPAQVRVETSAGELLAEGSVALDTETWRSEARRQGGWLPGRQQGALWLGVWPGEGTLAVPFSSELWVEVTRGPVSDGPRGTRLGDRRVAGAALQVELSGGELVTPATALHSDERGWLRLELRPQEHAILLQLHARWTAGSRDVLASEGPEPLALPPGAPGSPDSGEWFGALPVTPGALHAALDGSRLLVRSPIPRDLAYVSIVNEQHRLAGYIVPLQPDAEGGASAKVALEAELLARDGELYAVVSSEPDKRSPSAVGWRLRRPAAPEVVHTFDVADQLLLDGTAGVLQREQRARLARRRVAAALLALTGAGMVALFALEARRSAQRAAAAPAELELRSQRWWLALALGCLLLGMGALAYFGLLQR